MFVTAQRLGLNEVNTELLLELTKSYTTPCMEAQRLRQKRATVELRENPGVNQGLTRKFLLFYCTYLEQ